MYAFLANSTNYYVSPSGNDYSDGKTVATAFKTFATAVSLTMPGDTVFLLNGTHELKSTLTINRSGNDKAYIVLTNFPVCGLQFPFVQSVTWHFTEQASSSVSILSQGSISALIIALQVNVKL